MSIQTIVIDPGHGGNDSGAMGPSGLRECDVCLAVALRVRERLYGSVNVLLTRDDDTFITLRQRSTIANLIDARAFLSIHCNASETHTGKGFEIFSTGSKGGSALAAAVLESFAAIAPGPNRGSKVASFSVLRNTVMPAALLEMEFIDTPSGEAWLDDESNLDRCADAICEGMLAFLGVSSDAGTAPLPPVPSEPSTSIKADLEAVRADIDRILKSL